MTDHFKRTRIWIDPRLQWKLLLRFILYMAVYTLTLLHIGFAFKVCQTILWRGADTPVAQLYVDYLAQNEAILVAVAIILPLLIYDLVKFSNRIAGPLYRCRKVMLEMIDGKPVPEFVPRRRDLLGEFFGTFNQLIIAWNERVGVGEEDLRHRPGRPHRSRSPPPAK